MSGTNSKGITKSLVAVATATALGFSPAVHANNACSTAAQVGADLWKEYDDVVKNVGCVGVTAGAVVGTAGVGLLASQKIYSKCMTVADDADEATRNMISSWNDMVGNNWAHIGPRSLPLGETQKGTVTSRGTRLYITPAPVTGALHLNLEKVKFKGKTTVSVCTFAPGSDPTDHNVNSNEIWSFTIDPGPQNIDKTWSKTFPAAFGHIVAVTFKGKSVAKSMRYELRAESQPVNAVVIDGSAGSGSTDYTIDGGGAIEQVARKMGDIDVTIQANDKVSGNRADGAVGAGADGFLVAGELPRITLENPANARILVNGQPYNTVVIDGSAGSGSTSYTISGGGDIRQVKGSLAGQDVTIQANDNVSGDRANGAVGAGSDGFIVLGELPTITLENPDNAQVLVNGEPYHTVVIAGAEAAGTTGYTIRNGGRIQQVSGSLAGYDVSIQSGDNVSATTATGQVAGGNDGFVVYGDKPEVKLDNAGNAVVYINGKKM